MKWLHTSFLLVKILSYKMLVSCLSSSLSLSGWAGLALYYAQTYFFVRSEVHSPLKCLHTSFLLVKILSYKMLVSCLSSSLSLSLRLGWFGIILCTNLFFFVRSEVMIMKGAGGNTFFWSTCDQNRRLIYSVQDKLT